MANTTGKGETSGGERHMIDSRYYIMRTTAAKAGKLGNRTEKVIERGW